MNEPSTSDGFVVEKVVVDVEGADKGISSTTFSSWKIARDDGGKQTYSD